MSRYRYTQTYRSSYGAGNEGTEVNIDDERAAAINRDAPGTLVLVEDEPEPEPETRALDKPPADRQVKRAPRKRGAA